MDKELHYTILDTPVGLIGLVADARGLMVLEYIFCTEKEYQEILQFFIDMGWEKSPFIF